MFCLFFLITKEGRVRKQREINTAFFLNYIDGKYIFAPL
jgi:hypothetical protein